MTTWFGAAAGASDQQYSPQLLKGHAFAAPASGNITQARAMLGHSGVGGTSDIPIRVYVYAVSAGAPAALLGQSDELLISYPNATSLRTFTFSTPVAVVSGSDYFLMLLLGGGANAYFRSSGSGTGYYRTPITYPSAPNPFGAGTSFSGGPTWLEGGIDPATVPLVKAGVASLGGAGAGASLVVRGPVTSTKAGRGTVGLSASDTALVAPFEHPEGMFSVAFDAAPMAAHPHWTTVDALEGCRVRDWSIDRGRPNEFAKTDTGTATVRIVDRAGLFDPSNTSSPYHGKVLPGKQAAIALRDPAVAGADEWHTLFRGFIESWHYRLDQTEQYMELELQLVDGFAVLARAELRVGVDGALPPYTGTPQAEALAELAAGNVLYGETEGSVEDRILAILGDVGWPVSLTDVFSGNVRVGPKAYGPGTASALDALWDAVDAEFPGVGNLWCSKDGAVTFRGRQARFRPEVAEYGIQRRTVGDPSATGLDEDVVPISELEWSLGFDNVYNAASATPQWVGTGASIRQLNPDPPSNDNVAGQYVKAGDPGVGGDPDSIEKYWLRSITFDNLQTVEGLATGNNSMVETKRFATYYVTNFSTPAPRVSRIVFKSRRPGDRLGPSLWEHLTQCEISDLLTVTTAHPGGGGFLGDYYVEGLHYTGRPGTPDYPVVELSLDLSPRANWDTNVFDEDEDP